jgi:hypothetical protein
VLFRSTAVGAYATASSIATGAAMWPTADDSLPPQGKYAPIDFNASFVDNGGKTMSFYPDFISNLPRHWDEGVWRLDSAAGVSVDMDPNKY